MGYVGRRRVIDDYTATNSWWSAYHAPHTYTTGQAGLQATSSRNNPGWRAYKRDGRRSPARADLGGEFITIRHSVNNGAKMCVGNNGYAQSSPYHFSIAGEILPCSTVVSASYVDPDLYGPSAVTGLMSFPSDPTMDGLGATAIARCAPTSPHAGLATAIAELKSDGIPSLTSATIKGLERGSFKGTARDIASDNLKAQFELLPLISDFNSAREAIRERSKILQQYARDSGRSVRRTYRFPVDVSITTPFTNSTTQGNEWPVLTSLVMAHGSLSKTVRTTTETWFTGSFVYHRAGGDTQWSRLHQRYQDMNHLLGTSVGVGTVWNLLPWSWAVDWFTNVGDVMKNVQMMMDDGLIMEYGYVMKTTTVETELTRRGLRFFPSFLPLVAPDPFTASTTRVTKRRRKANPFGFGTEFSSLSGRQMSILTSLGITRSVRVP